MIPVFLGALYVAIRITSAGMGIRSLPHSRPRLILCIALTVTGAGYFQTPIRIGTDSEIVCVELR
jgi:hypothetical protein